MRVTRACWAALLVAGCGDVDRPPVLSTAPLVLTVQRSGGEGTVLTEHPGILCAVGCSEARADYTAGETVVLAVRHGVGARFVRWEGACEGQGLFCTLTMDRDLTTRAVFAERADLPTCGTDRSRRGFFTRSLVDPEFIRVIDPMGSLDPPEHVIPNRHMFLRVGGLPASQAQAPVHAPSDGVISALMTSWNERLSKYDYYYSFSPCREVELFVGLVHDVPDGLRERLGLPDACYGGTCFWNSLSVPVTAGDPVGFTHTSQGMIAIEAFDTRQATQRFANPRRYRYERINIQCPLDYFVTEGANSVGTMLRTRLSSEQMDCGVINQDVPGSGRGAWFRTGDMPWVGERTRLGLFHDNRGRRDPVFSVGESLPALSPGVYRYSPDSASSTHNVPFDRITPGAIYCYDGLTRWQGGRSTPEPQVILLQMSDPTHLAVEVRSAPDCTGLGSTGPLTPELLGPVIGFER